MARSWFSAERTRAGAPSWRRRAAARSAPPFAPMRSKTAAAARASSIALGLSPPAASDSASATRAVASRNGRSLKIARALSKLAIACSCSPRAAATRPAASAASPSTVGVAPRSASATELVGSVVGGVEVAERDLGLDHASQQLRRAQDVALHLLEAAPSGGRRELGLALQQAKPSDRLAGGDTVFIGSEQRRRLVDASLLESHPREVACRLEPVARVPRRGR